MKAYCQYLILITLLQGACSGAGGDKETESKPPRIKKTTSVVAPKANATYRLGATIPFEIKSENPVDSIVLDLEGKTFTASSAKFDYPATNARTGKPRLRLTVYAAGVVETHYPRITFLAEAEPAPYTYRIVTSYPHSHTSYTQGLFFKNDTLFESTGQKGASRLIKVDLKTGEPLQTATIGSEYFGEGSTWIADKIVMLTWTSQTGFVFDSNLQQTGTFRYTHEGWGLTTYGEVLVASDGTEVLHVIDPRDFSELRKLEVYDHKGPVKDLNELEMIDGLLYANVYQEDLIVVIDPATGAVLRAIDMSGLLTPQQAAAPEIDVLNGIAHNPESGKIYVTGKNWPRLYEVVFLPKTNNP